MARSDDSGNVRISSLDERGMSTVARFTLVTGIILAIFLGAFWFVARTEGWTSLTEEWLEKRLGMELNVGRTKIGFPYVLVAENVEAVVLVRDSTWRMPMLRQHPSFFVDEIVTAHHDISVPALSLSIEAIEHVLTNIVIAVNAGDEVRDGPANSRVPRATATHVALVRVQYDSLVLRSVVTDNFCTFVRRVVIHYQ